jgi:hypothetical protein
MSVTIIYDYQFIKINDKYFIPVLYYGSSNCTMMSPKTGREVLAKDWCSTRFDNKKLITTLDDVIKSIDEHFNSKINNY